MRSICCRRGRPGDDLAGQKETRQGGRAQGQAWASRCHDCLLRQGPFPDDMTRLVGRCDMGAEISLAVDACR